MALTYLPWATTRVSALDRPGSAAPANRPTVSLDVVVSSSAGSNQSVAPTLRVLGPGDVLGFAASHVVRTDPPDGATAADTTTFVSVDLDSAVLPWMITPALPAGGQATPWIVLIVVENTDGVSYDADARRLTIDAPADPSAQLPDLGQSWAWAHVQYAGDLTGADVPTALADPSRSVARLMCGRVLAGGRNYHACVVPAWAAGRDAGLGGAPDPDAAAAPAWAQPAGSGPVTLPVYHHFSFTTGDAGDFLGLASLIANAQPWAPPVADESRTLILTWTDDTDTQHQTTLPAPTVLDLGAPAASVNADAAAAWLAGQLIPPPAADGGTRDGLTLPFYGAVLAGFDVAAPGASLDQAPDWLRTLSTDARLRVAAGWGSVVVAQHAEDLVTTAFDQVGNAWAAREQLSRAQLARAVGQRQVDQHVTGSATALAQLLGPQSDRVATDAGTLVQTFAAVDPQLRVKASAAYRRITRGTPVTAASDDTLARRVAASLNPTIAVSDRVLAEHLTPTGASQDALAAAHDTLRAPAIGISYPTPMLGALLRLDPTTVLPGLDTIPANTAVLLTADPAVITAYLVGLNHALQRLLQWRDVPADPRATAFRQFWGDGDDIDPITAADPTPSGTGTAVLVLRSDLFRCYPRTVVYAHPAQASEPHFSFDATAIVQPSFSVPLPPDLRLLGFDLAASDLVADPGYYIVFQEQASETRFGTDPLRPGAAATGTHWTLNDLAAADPAGGGAPASSAAVANLTASPLVLVPVHASRFVPAVT